MRGYELVEGVEDGIDFDAAYRVAGYGGVAWRLMGWAMAAVPVLVELDDPDDPCCGELIPTGDYEDEPDYGFVIARMVGDDRDFTIDRDDLTKIDEDEFCGCCGQIGCAWGRSA